VVQDLWTASLSVEVLVVVSVLPAEAVLVKYLTCLTLI
jgi:hypothetical protein